jgi:hypothetical protein
MKSGVDPKQIERLLALAHTKNPDLAEAPLERPLRTTLGSKHYLIEKKTMSKDSTPLWFAAAAGLGLVAFWSLHKKEAASEEAPSDLVARELAEMSRMPLELRERLVEIGVGIGYTQGSTVMGNPQDQASIDAAREFADELDAEGFPLVAREVRQAADTAQTRLTVH